MLTGFVSLWGAAGITGTAHDLSNTAWTGGGTEDNGELCVYCHTPHAANTSFTGAPIWNKGTPAGPFTLYGTTVGGTTAGHAGDNATVNASSMACLSCHDGVSAVNSVVNAPGSGLATADGDAFIGTNAQSFATLGLTGNASNIGTDLSNDHPVSIEYKPGVAGLKAKATAITGWTGATTIQGLLRTTGGLDYVECGSCHDPHNGADSKNASSVAFLRVQNAGSALCLGCHAK
ncbi:MAG: cytochrome c3 family protein [Sulfurimonas sp.]|nr:cytochrome c3 family protein [Sulfurimonas sp.]